MALPSVAAPALDAAIVHEKRTATITKAGPSNAPNEHGVRIVAAHEYKEAAACLAEAFRTDNVVRYAIDTPDRMHLSEHERFEMHKSAMEYVTYAHCLQGLVLAVGDNFDCVALWLPPGKNIDDWFTILRSGMWRLGFKLSKEGRIRFFEEFLPLLGRSKQEVLGERDNHSWYLNYIGTKAEARGRGYARKLIDHVTRMVSTMCFNFVVGHRLTSARPMQMEFRVILSLPTTSISSSMAKWASSCARRSTCTALPARNSEWMSWYANQSRRRAGSRRRMLALHL
jgi:ribosomal protein S18 acetylase RimI-like enzyme